MDGNMKISCVRRNQENIFPLYQKSYMYIWCAWTSSHGNIHNFPEAFVFRLSFVEKINWKQDFFFKCEYG